MLQARAGKNLELTAVVYGVPSPEVTWSQEGDAVVQESDRLKIIRKGG